MSLVEPFYSAASFNNTNNIVPTDIGSVFQTNADPVLQEVNIYDADYGDTGWQGRWLCDVWGGFTVCTRGKVQLNYYYGPYPAQEARSLMCEEVGHSVGLAHSTDPNEFTKSCMSQNPEEVFLSNHDENHINAIY